MLDRGGFDPGAQIAFVALAAVTVAAAAFVDEAVAIATLRALPVLSLLGLAALALLSSAWTTIEPMDSLRWGLVLCGYVAIALTGGVLCARLGPVPIAAVLVGAAVLAGLLGLWAVALRRLPEAEWLEGAWRPGGPLQYPNALALLQTCALIPLARFSLSHRREVAITSRSGLAIAAAVLALAGSPAALGLALAGLALALRWPASVLDASREEAYALCVVLAADALLAFLVAGGATDRSVSGGELGRTVGLAGLIVATPAITATCLRLATRSGSLRHAAPPALLGLVLAGVLLFGSTKAGDPLHGRGDLGRIGVETSLDRPLFGAGAASFELASLPHQKTSEQRTLFAHDLPVEAWAELGLLGLAFAVALYVCTAKLLIGARAAPGASLLAPCAAMFLLSNLIDWSWHEPGIAALWALCLGGLTQMRFPSRRGAQGSPAPIR